MAVPRKTIPDQDHVVRYVPISRQARDENGDLMGNGLLWSALQQKKNEDFVSVNWLEYHGKARGNALSQAESLKLVRDDLAGVFPPKSRTKALLAIGNVGKIKRACAEAGNVVRVTHEPTGNNPSHAGIRRLPTDEDALLDLLAAEVFVDTVAVTAA